jgi:hypothetical protein
VEYTFSVFDRPEDGSDGTFIVYYTSGAKDEPVAAIAGIPAAEASASVSF